MERKNKFCKIPEEIITKAIELYKSGVSITKISKELHLDRGNLSIRLKENGCEIKQHCNKKKVNEEFFDVLNQDSSYWLGFIFADGYLSDSNGLEISSKDKEHIEKFKECIGSTHKIGVKVINGCEYYRINITNKKIAASLRKYGIHNKKSYGWKIPEMSKEMHCHFIRGLIDGDGTISDNRIGRTLDIRICSYSKEVLINVLDLIQNSVDLKNNWSIYSSEKRIPYLRINNYGTQREFLKWLYNDATIYLNRKHEKALCILPS